MDGMGRVAEWMGKQMGSYDEGVGKGWERNEKGMGWEEMRKGRGRNGEGTGKRRERDGMGREGNRLRLRKREVSLFASCCGFAPWMKILIDTGYSWSLVESDHFIY